MFDEDQLIQEVSLVLDLDDDDQANTRAPEIKKAFSLRCYNAVLEEALKNHYGHLYDFSVRVENDLGRPFIQALDREVFVLRMVSRASRFIESKLSHAVVSAMSALLAETKLYDEYHFFSDDVDQYGDVYGMNEWVDEENGESMRYYGPLPKGSVREKRKTEALLAHKQERERVSQRVLPWKRDLDLLTSFWQTYYFKEAKTRQKDGKPTSYHLPGFDAGFKTTQPKVTKAKKCYSRNKDEEKWQVLVKAIVPDMPDDLIERLGAKVNSRENQPRSIALEWAARISGKDEGYPANFYDAGHLARLCPFTPRSTRCQLGARITSAGFLRCHFLIPTFENGNYSTDNVLPEPAHR